MEDGRRGRWGMREGRRERREEWEMGDGRGRREMEGGRQEMEGEDGRWKEGDGKREEGEMKDGKIPHLVAKRARDVLSATASRPGSGSRRLTS